MSQRIGVVAQGLPAAVSDGSQAQQRLGKYNEAHRIDSGTWERSLCNSGQCFVAVNSTPGTGITDNPGAFSDTNNLMVLVNQGTKIVIPYYIRLLHTGTALSGTHSGRFTFVTDIINRYSSGGSILSVSNRASSQFQSSLSFIRFGTVVATAPTSQKRIVSQVEFSKGANVITPGDQFFVSFYNVNSNFGTLQVTTPKQCGLTCNPVMLAPNHSLLLNKSTEGATSAGVWEVEFVWFEV